MAGGHRTEVKLKHPSPLEVAEVAWLAASSKPRDREYAFARIALLSGPELLEFVATVSQLRGWGHGLKKAVARWYAARLPEKVLAEAQSTPEVQGWTHGKVIRMARPVPVTPAHNEAFQMLLEADRVAADRRAFKAIGWTDGE